MAIFSKSVLTSIRERVSIVSLIGERVPLKRAGRNYKGICPFHNEKTPSFNVSEEKGIFHCFGCGEGGDIFEFVSKFEGIGFSEAVIHLAGHAGIELPRDFNKRSLESEKGEDRKKRLYLRINEIARDFFVNSLQDENKGQAARQYLQLRGISDEFSKQLFLGYAENNWEALVSHLKEKRVPLDLAAELGLIKKRDSGSYYDFFRHRLIFPVISPRGEVLGFSGRDLGGDEAAKYINSPDSAIYHKSSCVLGLNLAQPAIRSENQIILVEGNVDLVSLYQAGIKNVVAPLGTALTAGHIRLLKRYTRDIVVVFDGDGAGKRATIRALEIFISEGISPKTVALPDGEDPDSLIRKEGVDVFRKRILSARSLFEYFVDETMAAQGNDASGRVNALGTIVPVLALISEPAERAVYRRYVARVLDVDENSIENAVSRRGRSGSCKTGINTKDEQTAKKGSTNAAEKMLIELIIAKPDIAKRVFEEIAPSSFRDDWCRSLADLIKKRIEVSGKLEIGELIGETIDSELASQIRQMAVGNNFEGLEDDAAVAGDCIARIKDRPAVERMEEINREIRRAETERNEGAILTLLREKNELASRMRNI